MKRNFLLYMAIGAALYGAVSCSDLKFGDHFLEKAPGTDITIDTIFSSKLYADRALTAAYATLRSGLVIHMNNGEYYEFQSAGNKLGWDSMDAITDIIQSHCTWAGCYGMYYPGNYSAESENGNGSTKFGFNPTEEGAWTGIRRAYIYIENVDRVPDMSDEEKSVRKGECYMIIAAQYSEMLRHFGGVPILRSSISAANQSTADFSRKTFGETLDFIVETCDKAAAMLPWRTASTDDGRFTKAAAMALKVRVLLYAASPLFNAPEPYLTPAKPTNTNLGKISDEDLMQMTWLGGYKEERWQAVIDACEAFIEENEANGNAYKLVESNTPSPQGYREAFAKCYADRDNGEIILGTSRTTRTFGDTYHAKIYGIGYEEYNGVVNYERSQGVGCVTLNYVDLFETKDGKKARYEDWISKNGHIGSLENNPFTDRDPRLYESVAIAGDKFRDRVAEMWVGGKEDLMQCLTTGFHVRKFLWDYNAATFFDKPANYPYLRLPEIYLAYAEALNETGRKSEAFTWLNKTRNRVGLPDISDELLADVHGGETLPSYPGLKGDPRLRQEILDERAREFCMEEVRWFDLVRWKRSDVFQKSLQGIQITLEGSHSIDEYYQGSISGADFKLVYSDPFEENDRYWKSNFSPKWYMSALPSNEINKGYGLIQNPGWE